MAQEPVSLRQVAVIPHVPGLDRPPVDVAIRGSDIYVLDAGRWRVLKLSGGGHEPEQVFGHARQGRSCGRFVRPAEVAVSEDGGVGVWDVGDRSLTLFRPDGACWARFAADVMEVVFDLRFDGDTLLLSGVDADRRYTEVALATDGRVLHRRAYHVFGSGLPDDLETCGGGASLPALVARVAPATPERTRLFYCKISMTSSIYVEYIEAKDGTNLHVIDSRTDEVATASVGIPLWFYDADTELGRLVALRQILKPDLVVYETQ